MWQMQRSSIDFRQSRLLNITRTIIPVGLTSLCAGGRSGYAASPRNLKTAKARGLTAPTS
jgi:hypothetical protein